MKKYNNGTECIEECPIGFKENENKDECIMVIKVINDNLAKVPFSKNEILSSIKQLKDVYLSEKKTIQGEGYMF